MRRPSSHLASPSLRTSITRAIGALTWIVLLAIGGCGQRNAARLATATSSAFDVGPRAVTEPVNGVLAAEGGRLYGTKGCVGCHVRNPIMYPDLVGVSTRRTSRWIEQFVLHPEVMVSEDSIGRKLMDVYTIQMPNFELTPTEARALVEYFKLQDRGPVRVALASH